MARKIAPIDLDHLVHLYISEKRSVLHLSKELGIGRRVIQRMLKEAGVSIRGRSEAEVLKWSQMDETARKKQVGAAHIARRGQTDSLTVKRKRALTNSRLTTRIYPREGKFAEALLKKHGIKTIPQFPVGPYNCDLATTPVAVEVQSYCRDVHLIRRQGKRTHYLMNRGWDVLFVFADRNGRIGMRAAKHAAAYIKRRCGNETPRREYRMIGGTGKLISSGGPEDNERTIIAAFKHALKAARRKNHRVPG